MPTTPTISAITGISSTTEVSHYLNPQNDNEVVIEHDGFTYVVSKREWNMFSIHAHILSIDVAHNAMV